MLLWLAGAVGVGSESPGLFYMYNDPSCGRGPPSGVKEAFGIISGVLGGCIWGDCPFPVCSEILFRCFCFGAVLGGLSDVFGLTFESLCLMVICVSWRLSSMDLAFHLGPTIPKEKPHPGKPDLLIFAL